MRREIDPRAVREQVVETLVVQLGIGILAGLITDHSTQMLAHEIGGLAIGFEDLFV